MKIPKSMTINGQQWTVRLKPLTRRGLDGFCNRRTREISIDEVLTADEQLDVFLHEVLHACIREHEYIDEEIEERLISRLVPRLLAALRGIGWIP